LEARSYAAAGGIALDGPHELNCRLDRTKLHEFATNVAIHERAGPRVLDHLVLRDPFCIDGCIAASPSGQNVLFDGTCSETDILQKTRTGYVTWAEEQSIQVLAGIEIGQ
jgi:hypothetical protein